MAPGMKWGYDLAKEYDFLRPMVMGMFGKKTESPSGTSPGLGQTTISQKPSITGSDIYQKQQQPQQTNGSLLGNSLYNMMNLRRY